MSVGDLQLTEPKHEKEIQQFTQVHKLVPVGKGQLQLTTNIFKIKVSYLHNVIIQ